MSTNGVAETSKLKKNKRKSEHVSRSASSSNTESKEAKKARRRKSDSAITRNKKDMETEINKKKKGERKNKETSDNEKDGRKLKRKPTDGKVRKSKGRRKEKNEEQENQAQQEQLVANGNEKSNKKQTTTTTKEESADVSKSNTTKENNKGKKNSIKDKQEKEEKDGTNSNNDGAENNESETVNKPTKKRKKKDKEKDKPKKDKNKENSNDIKEAKTKDVDVNKSSDNTDTTGDNDQKIQEEEKGNEENKSDKGEEKEKGNDNDNDNDNEEEKHNDNNNNNNKKKSKKSKENEKESESESESKNENENKPKSDEVVPNDDDNNNNENEEEIAKENEKAKTKKQKIQSKSKIETDPTTPENKRAKKRSSNSNSNSNSNSSSNSKKGILNNENTALPNIIYDSDASDDDEDDESWDEDENDDEDVDEYCEDIYISSRLFLDDPKNLVPFLLAIRTSIIQTYKQCFAIEEDDYKEVKTFATYAAGTTKIKFRSYSPKVFEYLRRLFKIDPNHFLWSWSNNNLKCSNSGGKSGANFIYSQDSSYILKTLTPIEARWLNELLPAYKDHIEKYPDSLLMAFLGLFSILYGKKRIFFTIMPNLFPPGIKMQETYDLKGSTVDRITKSSSGVQKDQNIMQSKRKFLLTKSKQFLVTQIRNDAEFLRDHNLMDYSLLVGVLKRTQENAKALETSNAANSATKNQKKAPSMVFFVRDLDAKKQKIKLTDSDVAANNPKPPPIAAKPVLKHFKSLGDRGLVSPSKADLLRQVSLKEASLAAKKKKKAKAASQQLQTKLYSTPTLFSEKIERNELEIVEEKPVSKFTKDNGGIVSEDKEHSELYFISIIDFLQKYNKRKKLAHFTKSITKDGKQLSTVEPKLYAQRFISFMESCIE